MRANCCRREWLLTNGLGGYASGTISGSVSRRYHGLLIAALPAPLGRVVMFNHLAEYLRMPDGRLLQIGGEEPSHPDETEHIGEGTTSLSFAWSGSCPSGASRSEGVHIEKRLLLVHGQNTVHVNYSLLSKHDGVRLELRPSLHFPPARKRCGAAAGREILADHSRAAVRGRRGRALSLRCAF